MAHGTHTDANPERNKSIVSFKSSFWLAVILVGLFVAALNFVNVMGSHEEGHGEHGAKAAEHTEMQSEKPAHESTAAGEAVHEAKNEHKDETVPEPEPGKGPAPTPGKETAPEHK